ncbi:MAG: polysaccharide biosynthesis protein [Clostridia bacterium]|nr:polysaccharide biosynthesis protein [Clostridia bacterium]
MNHIVKRGLPLMFADLLIVNIAFILAAFVNNLVDYKGFDFWPTSRYFILSISLYATPVAIAVNAVFGLYSSLWHYAGLTEFIKLMAAVLIDGLLFYLAADTWDWRMGPGMYIPALIILFMLMAAIRFGFRVVRRLVPMMTSGRFLNARRTMIVGAGEAGAIMVHTMMDDPAKRGLPVVLVDDDPAKRGFKILGVRVAGNRQAIPRLVREFGVERIFIAVPRSSAEDMKDLLEICLGTGCEIQRVDLADVINGTPVEEAKGPARTGDTPGVRVGAIPLETLLGRDPVSMDNSKVREWLRGRSVLVTGGGGSIGSELCRQVASYDPSRLVIFDVYENTSYELALELRHKHPEIDIVLVIGSIRDREKLTATFRTHQPQVVFHAAAHKHVSTMENDPEEAIKNNVFGTYNVCDLAQEYGVERFILISTDKAVNPTNVMGASKRLCEYVVKGMSDRPGKTVFSAVRFGNVLGSNGSVIPIFRRQIAEGGPVTVTDKNVIRYFMTISEAASLVIMAGVKAQAGEIYILDMGEPVRIDDMVRKMIRLAGLVPEVDIEIQYVGLRPGEKMYEELSLAAEELIPTDEPKIMRTRDKGFTGEQLDQMMDLLHETLDADGDVRQALVRLIPTYVPDNRGHVRDTSSHTGDSACTVS